MSFKLVIISPEKKVLEMDCKSVTVPTSEGQITVLPKHISIFSILTAGEVIARTTDKDISITVGGGFVSVSGDKVTILPEFGVKSDEIDEEKVKEAKKRAEEIIKNQEDNKGSALAEATLARSLIELKIAHKRRKS